MNDNRTLETYRHSLCSATGSSHHGLHLAALHIRPPTLSLCTIHLVSNHMGKKGKRVRLTDFLALLNLLLIVSIQLVDFVGQLHNR